MTEKGEGQSRNWAPEANLKLRLDEFFVGVELAVFGSVMQRDVAVSAFFELIDLAGIERL